MFLVTIFEGHPRNEHPSYGPAPLTIKKIILIFLDMIFFERRLTEVIGSMQPTAYKWRSKFLKFCYNFLNLFKLY